MKHPLHCDIERQRDPKGWAMDEPDPATISDEEWRSIEEALKLPKRWQRIPGEFTPDSTV